MGFHKRYINDQHVIDIYKSRGSLGVIKYFTEGVDAVITSGKLAEKVSALILEGSVREKISQRLSILIEGFHQKDLKI